MMSCHWTRATFESEGIRYYSNVMTTFTSSLRKAIEKAKALEINIIAPGHGPVYRKNPQKSSVIIPGFLNMRKEPKNEVTILWGSMYGMTAKAVDHVESILQREGVKYNKLELPLKVIVKWSRPFSKRRDYYCCPYL